MGKTQVTGASRIKVSDVPAEDLGLDRSSEMQTQDASGGKCSWVWYSVPVLVAILVVAAVAYQLRVQRIALRNLESSQPSVEDLAYMTDMLPKELRAALSASLEDVGKRLDYIEERMLDIPHGTPHAEGFQVEEIRDPEAGPIVTEQPTADGGVAV